jgi:general secretion pathway protein G
MRNRRFPSRSPAALQRGMSLIEIIIVIVLIGLVLTVVMSRVLGGADSGKVKITKTQLAGIAEKIERFEMDTGRKPASLQELVAQPANAAGWLGPYAKAPELKDQWGNEIFFQAPGKDGRAYELGSFGKDGKPGGTSVDADIVFE